MKEKRYATGDILLVERNARSARVLDVVSNRVHEISAFHLSLLEGAGHFADLESHANAACQRLQIDPGQAEVVMSRLEELSKLGLLPSEDDARSWLRESAATDQQTADQPIEVSDALPSPDQLRELEQKLAQEHPSLRAEITYLLSGPSASKNAALLDRSVACRFFVPPGFVEGAKTASESGKARALVVVEHAPRTESQGHALEQRVFLEQLGLVGHSVASFVDGLAFDAAAPRFLHRLRGGRVRLVAFGQLADDRVVAPSNILLARSGPFSAGAVAVDTRGGVAPFFGTGSQSFIEAELLSHPKDVVAFPTIGGPSPELPLLDEDDRLALLIRATEPPPDETDPLARLAAIGRQLVGFAKRSAQEVATELRVLHLTRVAEAVAELEMVGPGDDEEGFEEALQALTDQLDGDDPALDGEQIRQSVSAAGRALQAWAKINAAAAP
ncbi:MAG: hypothetical protein HY791_09935 [Deltaproteobacteria bacterium]|nr:hypothetical protein [Deltaproteobacteria bacterium]